MTTLEKIIEERAQAVAQLAYLKAVRPARLTRRLHSSKSLYFALCGDAVKIGVSSSPESRLDALQVGAPSKLYLLATIPEMGKKEAECHRRLAHLQLHGEWFRYTEEVDNLIKELQNG